MEDFVEKLADYMADGGAGDSTPIARRLVQEIRRETAREILERCRTHEFEPFDHFVEWVEARFGLEDDDADK